MEARLLRLEHIKSLILKIKMDKSQKLTILAVENPWVEDSKTNYICHKMWKKEALHNRLLLLLGSNGTEHHEHNNRNLNKLIVC